MPSVGQTVRVLWTIFDQSGNPLTGMAAPADITFKLNRTVSNKIVKATETITMVELADDPGSYEIKFPPDFQGLYTLQLKELNVNTNGDQYRFPIEVFAAGAEYLPAFANAFCSEADVARWSQLSFDDTSKPTSLEVAGFAEGRASEIISVMAGALWTITPATVTDGSVEQDMLRECNAVGAAADAWLAKVLDTDPGRSDKVKDLFDEYEKRLTRLAEYAKKILGGHRIGSPMAAGEVTLRDETPITDMGLSFGITADQEF